PSRGRPTVTTGAVLRIGGSPLFPSAPPSGWTSPPTPGEGAGGVRYPRRMTGGVPHTGTTGVFVGRASERAHLTEVLAGTGPGDPTSVVVLAGEPGVGKSALLDAVLAPAVVPAHARVVRVRGDEAETELDFGLVDQVMGALDRAPAAAQLAGRDP